jgi:hypothetical protein
VGDLQGGFTGSTSSAIGTPRDGGHLGDVDGVHVVRLAP